jgi:hypothetical protein
MLSFLLQHHKDGFLTPESGPWDPDSGIEKIFLVLCSFEKIQCIYLLRVRLKELETDPPL